MFLEVEEGGQDQDEAVKVYLIRFIADLPQGWYMGCVIEYLQLNHKIPMMGSLRQCIS